MTDEFTLKIYTLKEAQATILQRHPLTATVENLFDQTVTAQEAARRIVEDVRLNGDAALKQWDQKLLQAPLADLTVSVDDIKAAPKTIPAETLEALQIASRRSKTFHRMQPLKQWVEHGVGQLIRPLARVGIYVPRGFPSSLIMSAVPALVAGVKEIIVCTPGSVSTTMLAAAAICGIDKIYQTGGPQAIAAMAYGTDTIAPVDKIVGSGDLLVSYAKQAVFGIVGVDGFLGSNESLIIADEHAQAGYVAADMLAQVEHGTDTSAIVLTTSQDTATAIVQAINQQLSKLDNADILKKTLGQRSSLVLVDNIEQAFTVANAYAPEYLCLAIRDAREWIGHIQNAGSVFVGTHSFKVLGDYMAGPSHIMPTQGTAHFASPLNIWDFVKITSLVHFDAATANPLIPIAAQLAQAEGLVAHEAAAKARYGDRRFVGQIDKLHSPERIAMMEVERVVDLSLDQLEATSALDVGTGGGLFAEAFLKRGLYVSGLDVNPDILAAARAFAPEADFKEGVAEHLPYQDNSFDVVFMGHVLHEVDDFAQTLKEARRVARHRVIVLEWPHREESHGPPLSHRLKPDDVNTYAKQAGFTTVEVTDLQHMVLYRLNI